jgi:hypothetical protein
MKRMRFLISSVVTLACAQIVLAGGIVNTADEASLRAAMSGGGLVTFNCDGTIVLGGTLIFDADTVLDASGHDITLNGNGAVRVFNVPQGISVTLSNLAVKRGRDTGTNSTKVGDGGPARGVQGTLPVLSMSFPVVSRIMPP